MSPVILRSALALLLAASASAVDAIYVVTAANRLVRFRSDTPGTVIQVTAAITGLQIGETVLGLDRRPATGELLALGSTNQLYSIAPTTGVATPIGTPFTPTLSGTSFGFDVNPTADRVRVVSNTGQNLRLNPDTGAVASTDINLGYALGDANVGATPSVMTAAYTNNLAGATTTTLYVLDAGLDILATQLPPNNGTLNTVGPLGINIDTNASFDISGVNGIAYAVLQVAGTPNLYTINLTTGAATLIGAVNVTGPVTGMTVGPAPGSIRFTYAHYTTAENAGSASIALLREAGSQGAVGVTFATFATGSATTTTDYTAVSTTVTFADGETVKTVPIPIVDDALVEDLETIPLTISGATGGADVAGPTSTVLAIVDNEMLPATVVALTATNTLVQFNAATPGTITSTITVTGLAGGENLLGIDYRPSNGQLLALGSTSQLYVVTLGTGVATAVGTPFAPVLSGAAFGFDVNPSADRVRVVSDTGQNFRLNPDTGALAATDTALVYVVGDINAGATPAAMASAYTSNVAGATSTTLYTLDAGLDILATQVPPNNGTLNTVGALGAGVNALSASGFDIRTSGSTDSAFAALRVGSTSTFYAIKLTTGAASLIGTIGDGTLTITGMTLALGAGSAPPAGGGNTPSPSPSVSTTSSPCGVGGGAAAVGLMLLFALLGLALRRRR